MSLVAIRMLEEFGGVTAIFPLARRLRARGHEVVFLVAPPAAAHVAASGLDVEIAPGHAIHGTRGEDHAEFAGPLATVARRLFVMSCDETLPLVVRGTCERVWRRVIKPVVQSAYLRHEMEWTADWISRRTPDVALVDAVLPTCGLPFLEAGVPIVSVSTSFASRLNLHTPNVRSGAQPDVRGRLRTSLRSARELVHLRAVVEEAFRLFVTLPLAGLTIPGDVRRAGERVALHEYGVLLRAPTIVTMPWSFEFPSRPREPDRCYLGLCVDHDRAHAPVAWAGLREQAPLAYCALGTLTPRSQRLHVYRAVIDAFRDRPQWDVVIAGAAAFRDQLATPPPWIQLADFVPQVAILGRAQLFVTHAGASSIREAIFHGVPMVALPTGGDQFGNAARIAYHHLGLALPADKIDAARLGAMVDTVAGDPGIAAAVRTMRAACLADNGIEAGVRMIETVLADAMSA